MSRVGSDRVESGRVGSRQEVSQLSRIESGHAGPIRPAKSDLIRENIPGSLYRVPVNDVVSVALESMVQDRSCSSGLCF